MREVTVLSAGGTIASVDGAAGREGASPALDAAALVAAAPALAAVPGLRARSLRALPGPQLGLEDALEVARATAAETGSGRGVVLTTGTDTLEELAVLCDVLAGNDPARAPVVLTGAIRPASASGADGPANLIDAAALAAAPAAAGLGTVVCFAGEVHRARAVRKVDSAAPDAFASPRSGPIGRVVEGRPEIWARPPRWPAVSPARLDLTVPIVPTWLGDDGALLRAALDLRPDGIVLVALGGGHLPPPVLAVTREAAAAVPVAACLRPERGAFLHGTYGFEGAEGDVRATGVLPAGALAAPAARMLLLAGLGAGLDRPALAALLSTP